MTLSTIQNIMAVPTNKWIFLPKTAIITTNRNGNINVNGSYIFYFDSSNDLLYISINKKYLDLETLETSLNAYPITETVDIKTINGFVSAYSNGPAGMYLRK